MRFNITGLEDVPVYLAIIAFITVGWYVMDTGIGILGSHALGKWQEYEDKK